MRVRIQVITAIDEFTMRLLSVRNRAVSNQLDALLQLLRDQLARDIGAVTIQAQMAEADILQAP